MLLQLTIPALTAILLDRLTKRWMLAHPARELAVGSVVRLHCVINRDRAYQRSRTRFALAALWPGALACAALSYAHGLYFAGPLALPGLAIAFAGSASNLADIMRSRAIVDFVDLGWWPVFNVADMAIVIGLAVAFIP